MSGRQILITGGAGFIGFHLARELSEDAHDEIVLLDNLVRGRRDDDLEELLRRPNVRLETGDITDMSLWSRLSGPFDEIYHLAAIIGVEHVLCRPHDVVRVNALGTLALLDWFAKQSRGKLLFASTSEAYAWTGHIIDLPVPTPEDVPLSLTDLKDPRSSYAGSKIFGELAVTQYCLKFEKPFTIVRYHNVYGPRMGHEHVIPQLYKRAIDGESPLVVYSGHHRRAFCYVSDAVRNTVLAMRESAGDGMTFHVGNEEEIQIVDLAKLILKRAGKSPSVELRKAANDPIKRRCPDTSRARTQLGYKPVVSLDDGLDRTLEWYGRLFGV